LSLGRFKYGLLTAVSILLTGSSSSTKIVFVINAFFGSTEMGLIVTVLLESALRLRAVADADPDFDKSVEAKVGLDKSASLILLAEIGTDSEAVGVNNCMYSDIRVIIIVLHREDYGGLIRFKHSPCMVGTETSSSFSSSSSSLSSSISDQRILDVIVVSSIFLTAVLQITHDN
jgi:hypothetical protein